MEGSTIHVVTADGALRRALVARLGRSPRLHDQATGDPDFAAIRAGDIVISTPADCPPERAAELARTGVFVIILAAIPRPGEQARYEHAGAVAYIPMLIDGVELLRAIDRILDHSRCQTA